MNGGRYEGKFFPESSDRCKIFFPNGDYYEGQADECKMNGEGIFYSKDGTQYKGLFNANQLVRKID